MEIKKISGINYQNIWGLREVEVPCTAYEFPWGTVFTQNGKFAVHYTGIAPLDEVISAIKGIAGNENCDAGTYRFSISNEKPYSWEKGRVISARNYSYGKNELYSMIDISIVSNNSGVGISTFCTSKGENKDEIYFDIATPIENGKCMITDAITKYFVPMSFFMQVIDDLYEEYAY